MLDVLSDSSIKHFLRKRINSTRTLDTRVMKLFRLFLSSSFDGSNCSALFLGLFKQFDGRISDKPLKSTLLKSTLLATAMNRNSAEICCDVCQLAYILF